MVDGYDDENPIFLDVKEPGKTPGTDALVGGVVDIQITLLVNGYVI